MQTSSTSTPCPVCGRTHDGDCRITPDGLVLCHTYRDQDPGIAGWQFVKPSSDGNWGTFVPAKTARPAGSRHFVYQGSGGEPLLRVTRRDDGTGKKRIHQSVAVGDGSWQAGGVEAVADQIRLYRIDQARELAAQGSHPILVVEGESCVDDLMGLGIPATTSVGGAGKWGRYGHQNYARDLDGIRVILCPDCDQPGICHMREVMADLTHHGIQIAGWLLAPPWGNWANPPAKHGLDIGDWIERGATSEAIWAAVKTDLPAPISEQIDSFKTQKPNQGSDQKESTDAFSQLMQIAQAEAECWISSVDKVYADVVIDGIRKTFPIEGRHFKRWLATRMYEVHQKGVSSDAIEKVLNVLCGMASCKGPQREAHLRIAEHEGSIYIDMADERWQVIEVSKQGWRVIQSVDCPVRFVRAAPSYPCRCLSMEGICPRYGAYCL